MPPRRTYTFHGVLVVRVRIGIDVGGTFTDAVVLDSESYELLGQVKVPTTHSAPEGVAKGIVEALHRVLEEHQIDPGEVEFIAHGTTQATNALLEGDVVKVGVVSFGQGMEGRKVRLDTQIEPIELAQGRYLTSVQRHVEELQAAGQAICELRQEGAEVIVAAASFSVDDPSQEQAMMKQAVQAGLPAVGTHEISKLYGLKTRTKTAVINASILPKMMEAASLTEQSVKESGIAVPLMVMRCDGGVMNIDEVMRRPILTMLSGPAAGVAGALMYEKVSHGLFLEVGGTSTDISAVVNGRVMVDYAQVGGHKTYVNSLDVRTVAVAGGSMVRLGDGRIKDVGPRSAHIAGFPYAVFSDPERLTKLNVVTVRPRPEDALDYAAVENEYGERFAITVACAANFLGFVPEGDYARGNRESARLALEALGKAVGLSAEQAAERILELASAKCLPLVRQLLKDYAMDKDQTVLVGGGGGAAAVVPHLAKTLGMKHRIAKNAQVISPIGVALSLVRDTVERTIPNPSQEDILRIREEAERQVIKAGAKPDTVEVHVEIDAQRNLVRAVATGATELRTKERGVRLAREELRRKAAEAVGLPQELLRWKGGTELLEVFTGEQEVKKLFGLVRRSRQPLVVLDREGVIRLQLPHGLVLETTAAQVQADLQTALEKHSQYGDAGIEMPKPFLLVGGRVIDLTGLVSPEQVASLAAAELQHLPEKERVIILLGKRV